MAQKVRMKANNTFFGQEGMVRKGQLFDAESEKRAEQLERAGHATREKVVSETSKKKETHANKSTSPAENKVLSTAADSAGAVVEGTKKATRQIRRAARSEETGEKSE